MGELPIKHIGKGAHIDEDAELILEIFKHPGLTFNFRVRIDNNYWKLFRRLVSKKKLGTTNCI